MSEYEKLVAKLYALEKSGLSCEKELTFLAGACFGLTKDDLNKLYEKFAKEINESGLAKTDLAFREMLYLKHIEYFFNEVVREIEND